MFDPIAPTRGSKARIKFEVSIKTPSTGGLSAWNGNGVPYLL
ncbi:MAG TPA: hypothetical protein PKK06_18480 [Phycisphaerae bacterium]|nr:hypothetical protein [Phycisphaerae bacterium]